MRVQVRFFASLRERVGRSEQALSLSEGATVANVWERVVGEKQLPDNILAAINMDYVTASSVVSEGDEVAFFPPVTGG